MWRGDETGRERRGERIENVVKKMSRKREKVRERKPGQGEWELE